MWDKYDIVKMSEQRVRQRRSFFRRSEPFIKRNSTLLSIIGSSKELTERVLRERIEKFDVGRWSKDLEDIFETKGSNFDVQSSNFDVQSSNFDVQSSNFYVQSSNFDVQSSSFDVQLYEFLILSSMACIGVDKSDHLKKCLKYFSKNEDRKNHDLVS